MKQKIIHDYPPNIDEIDARFAVRGKPVLFSWGARIYNPRGIIIPPALIAHEAVHGERQGDDIEGWWRRYLHDPEFCLAEEVPAHRAELQVALAHCKNRNQKRLALRHISQRLAGPLYGRVVTRRDAQRLILAEAA